VPLIDVASQAVPLVHFSVCTHNDRDIIRATLDAIAGQGGDAWSCTVVDGCSVDGTVAEVRASHPDVTVIEKSEDSGPAASRNIGMTFCRSPYLVLLDSDVRLQPGWVAAQMAFLEENPDVGIVGGKLLLDSRPEVIDTVRGGLNRIGVAWDVGRGEAADTFDSPQRCMWLSTSAIMLRRSAVEAVGDFDEVLFAYHDDVDFGWRANVAGVGVAFNPRAEARHLTHGTFDKRVIGRRITYLLWRNRLRSMLVNYEAKNLVRYVPLHIFLSLPIIAVKPHRAQILAALWWNIVNIGNTWQRRATVQRRRKVKDSMLWPLFDETLRGAPEPGVNPGPGRTV
jgi:GT2 family glycosyltransferase